MHSYTGWDGDWNKICNEIITYTQSSPAKTELFDVFCKLNKAVQQKFYVSHQQLSDASTYAIDKVIQDLCERLFKDLYIKNLLSIPIDSLLKMSQNSPLTKEELNGICLASYQPNFELPSDVYLLIFNSHTKKHHLFISSNFTPEHGLSNLSPVFVPGLAPDEQIINITAGWHRLFALTDKGRIFNCGKQDRGELGRTAIRGERSLKPVPLPKEVSCSQIAVGREFTMVLSKDGRMLSCGRPEATGRDFASIGDSLSMHNILHPIKLLDPTVHFQQIATDEEHLIALDTLGNVYTYGENFNGQLGRDTSDKSIGNSKYLLPVKLPKKMRIIQVTAGAIHTGILSEEGEIFVCGSNYFGQLGNAVTSAGQDKLTVFAQLTVGSRSSASPNIRFSKILAGRTSMYAIDSNGNLYACGRNENGELGRQGYEKTLQCVTEGLWPNEKVHDMWRFGKQIWVITTQGRMLIPDRGALKEIGNAQYLMSSLTAY